MRSMARWMAAAALAALATGCARRESLIKGTIFVSGLGEDLVEVFDARNDIKVGFKRSGKRFDLRPGQYRVMCNKTSVTVDLKPGGRMALGLGALGVQGGGLDLYEVWDAEGAAKLQTKGTGKPTEVFAGSYTLTLNRTSQKVQVVGGQKKVLTSGSLVVNGSPEGTYTVFNSTGSVKIDSRMMNRAIELLPGPYTVTHGGRRAAAVVQPGRQTVIAGG